MKSSYSIDDKGIYYLEYFSYPDSIRRNDLVVFDSETRDENFESFVQMILEEGKKSRSREFKRLLG